MSLTNEVNTVSKQGKQRGKGREKEGKRERMGGARKRGKTDVKWDSRKISQMFG